MSDAALVPAEARLASQVSDTMLRYVQIVSDGSARLKAALVLALIATLSPALAQACGSRDAARLADRSDDQRQRSL